MIPTAAAGPSSEPVACAGGATFVNGRCVCPGGFPAEVCHDMPIQDSTFFMIHVLMFCVLFVVTGGWSLLNSAAALRLRSLASKGTFTEIPTVFLFLIIAAGSLARICSLSIDPYGIKSIIPQFWEAFLEGILIWSLYGAGILVIVVWNDTYTSWNPDTKSRFVRPIAFVSLVTLLVACVFIQWIQRTFPPELHVALAVISTFASILFCAGSIIRSTQLVRSLRLDKMNSRKAILMRKIQKITRHTMAVLIIVVLCRTLGTILAWTATSSYNFLFFQSLHRAMEVATYIYIMYIFQAHDFYEKAFCGGQRAVHFRMPDSGTRSRGSQTGSGYRFEDEIDEEQMLYDEEDEENIYNDDGSIMSAEEMGSANTSPRSSEWSSEFRSMESLDSEEASDGSISSQTKSRDSLP